MSLSFQNDIDRATTVHSAPSRAPFRVLREDSASSSDSCPLQTNQAIPSRPQASPHNIVPNVNQSDSNVFSTIQFVSSDTLLEYHSQANRNPSASDELEHRSSTRHSILAALPIPADIPDDALKPILIPAPFTLHEFLGNTTGVSTFYP